MHLKKAARTIYLGEESYVKQDFGFETRRMRKDSDGTALHEILRWSSEELYRYIQREMEINPLLKMREDSKRETDEVFDAKFPVDWDEWFQDADYDDETDSMNYYEEEHRRKCEGTAYSGITLQEHLMSQLKAMDIPPADERVAAFIIENLDENGYLPISKHEIAAILKVDRDRVSRMLRLVQTLDPPGVGARSLRECLLIQLTQMGKATPFVRTIILEHLKDIACNRLGVISRKTGISLEEVQRIRDLIRSLEPKPGRRFAASREVRYTTPDIAVKRIGDEYYVLVLQHAAPRLCINKMYLRLLQEPHLDKNVLEYIADKLNSALGLIKAVEQRRIALNKVAMSIVSRQKEFLDHGPKHLKPLTMQVVADDCGMHVSAVSRAVEDKYIQTPHGIFEIGYFFSAVSESPNGLKTTTDVIKQIVRAITK